MTISFPSGLIEVRIFVASEDATIGTVEGFFSVIKPRISCFCNEMRTKSLGHRKGRTYFPIQKRLKPLLLLLGVAVASEDLWIRGSTGRRVSESDSHKNARTRFTHVASVGRGAVRHLRAHVSTSPHDFGHDGILRNSGDVSRRGALLQKYESWGTHFEVSQGDTVLGVMGLAEEEVPEAEFAGLCLEFFDDGDDRLPPRCVTGELSSRQPLRRSHFLLQIRMSWDTSCS